MRMGPSNASPDYMGVLAVVDFPVGFLSLFDSTVNYKENASA